MSSHPQVTQILQQVRRRLWSRWLVRRTLWLTLLFSAVYLLLMLVGRLMGLFPDWFTPLTVLAVPVGALLVSLLLPGQPDLLQAAHVVDRHEKTHDLLLTFLTLQGSAPDYRPLLDQRAVELSQRVKPEVIVPFEWERSWVWSGGALAVLLLGAFFLPTLDPFRKVAQAEQVEEQRQLVEITREQTEERRAMLAEKDVESELSEAAQKALEALQGDFRKMESGNQRANLERLNKHQKEIGEMFRKLNSGELKSLFEKMDGQQKLGAIRDQELFRKWQKELQQGSSESMKNAVDQLKDDLERLTKTTDPLERTELERQIQKKLNELSDFSENNVGSKALTAALERAKQQLEAAKNGELSKEAMDALKESLELAQQEMELLAQSARDMQSLEEALEMISMAKQMNAENKLDGEMFPGEMTLEDYAELYAQMMGEMAGQGGEGEGEGDGLGGPGIGQGGEAPEDDSVTTDFVDEKSNAIVQKGKILLSMKTKGLSDSGDIADADYKRIVGEIQQSLDAAIEQERVPPGYLDNIKKYFDTLDR